MDFYQIAEKRRNGVLEVYPDFRPIRSKDLMVRGRSFYAIWDEQKQMWSTDEADVQRLVDRDLDTYKEERQKTWAGDIDLRRMISFSSNSWRNYRTFLREMFDTAHQLDENLTFSNMETRKTDYVSRRLPYPLEEGSIAAYDEIMSTIYEEEERQKLEWAIGSIISGDAKRIQKFIVLYGEAGSGKSTFLNIVQKLFEGYYTSFDAKALTSSSNSFSTETFRNNPLVAIQHDGDLSRIEDNTKLNSIVSHEEMQMNEKYKPSYTSRINAFLFMGTNKPVKITDAKSGIIRRLIDVRPSGNKLPVNRYLLLIGQIDFELGAIANHCLNVYKKLGKNYYSNYRPLEMMYQTDVFFNFVEDSYYIFKEQDGVSLNQAYEMYKNYCSEALVEYKLAKYKFRDELKSYFETFSDRTRMDGKQLRSYYSGFLYQKFAQSKDEPEREKPYSMSLDETTSIVDILLSDCSAQYATTTEKPKDKWVDVHTTLADLDTTKIHYVRPPVNHIVIDFDLKDQSGKKSMDLNLEAASKWPPTYAEFSKSGSGIHLHYIYDGDVDRLSRIYSEGIEIKVFVGNSSLRRKLSKCNNSPVATLNSGLPLKGEKMINPEAVKSEKGLRELINRNLRKEIHPGTKPSVDFIHKILDDAYSSDLRYDVTDMRAKILVFANNSSNQSEYCVKLVQKMKFVSKEPSEPSSDYASDDLIFYDVEVFPNLFVVVWKKDGEESKPVKMINPTPADIEKLLKFKLVGFNNRRYDNHILYGRFIGYNNKQLYDLSQRIIGAQKGDRGAGLFGEAYNLSYTDIYDFASAGNKKSLKKLEIEMGIHHQELGLPWDEPVPEHLWERVADYCVNDVVATNAAFHYLKGDWVARQILSDIAGMTVNDTTNSLSTRVIFDRNKNPQNEFNYRDLAEPVSSDRYDEYHTKFGPDYTFRVWDADGLPQYRDYIPGEKLPDGWSILPFFKGYTFSYGKSLYLGQEIGEGGRVYSEPGMYSRVWDADVTGQHPSSIIAEVLFGPKYTKAFKEIVDGRVSIKHKAWASIDNLFDGKLKPYIQLVIDGELSVKDLANALKTVVNSVYGLTSASFENPFRDPRNKDNIVAKRGSLFMTLLTKEVQDRGYTVCHNKTDSIKIPNADDSIRDFVLNFGAEYGYFFETEAEFDKFCLVNDAVYVAKYDTPLVDKDTGKETWWTATGTQFQVPYVFKTLFSKEPIEFSDLCETKSVTSSLYLDMNEKLADVSDLEKERDRLAKKDPPMGREGLDDEIAQGHNYVFIGKVGLFCPIVPGAGGGLLCREKDGKYYAATGSKGYRWLEAEMVKSLGLESAIDLDYYNRLVDDAVDTISEYGDYEWFVSDDPSVVTDIQEDPIGFNDAPPWCCPMGISDCCGCSNWVESSNTCREGFQCLPF